MAKQNTFSGRLCYKTVNKNYKHLQRNFDCGCRQLSSHKRLCGYLYTFSKNDVISSVRKQYCALGSLITKMYEAGHLDATELTPDSLTRLLDAKDILTLGTSWRGGHLDAKNVILKQKSLLQLR